MSVPKYRPRPGNPPVLEVLHKARLDQRIPLPDLADRTGWAISTISNMERGKAANWQCVLDCAQALGVTILALPPDAWDTSTLGPKICPPEPVNTAPGMRVAWGAT